MDMPLYPQYLPPIQHSYVPSMATPHVKQEAYGDDEMSPFSMSYASMAGMDVGYATPYVSTKSQPPSYNRSYTT